MDQWHRLEWDDNVRDFDSEAELWEFVREQGLERVTYSRMWRTEGSDAAPGIRRL